MTDGEQMKRKDIVNVSIDSQASFDTLESVK